MNCQIVSVSPGAASGTALPVKAVAAPLPAVTHETPSAFADLVQHLIGEPVPVRAVPAAAAKAPAPSQTATIAPARVPISAVAVDVVPAPAITVATGTPIEVPVVPDAPAEPPKTSARAAIQTPIPVIEVAVPVPAKVAEALATPGSSGPPRVARKTEAAKSAEAPAPFIAVALPDVVSLKPPKAEAADTPAHSAPAPVAAPADEPAATVSTPAAVEVKIHTQDSEPAQTAQSVAITAKAAPAFVLPPDMPVAAVPPATAPSAPATAIPITTPLQVQTQPATSKPAPPSGEILAQADEPTAPEPKSQPLRSVSIEFTPDGAQDVRLRLSEHAGDVHISLHTTDPSLSGRLNDGVKDLVDSLTTAGYDAQAWTPDQGRQNQRQAEEPRRMRNHGSGDPDAETFDGVMQQA